MARGLLGQKGFTSENNNTLILYNIWVIFQTFCKSELVLHCVLFAVSAMVSMSLNTIKQIMRAMVDCPGFDRVLSKVGVERNLWLILLGEPLVEM